MKNQELVEKARRLVCEERRITLELIETLREIDRRLVYAELGYGSLFEFAHKHLGLSEGAAHRRVQAARLVRDVPEVREQLASGALSLSNAARVQSFCQRTKLEKREILNQVQNLSQEACTQKLLQIAPEAIPQESKRQITPTQRELKFVVSEDQYQKLEELRGMLAHSHPHATLAELFDHMLHAAIEQQRKKRSMPERAASDHPAAGSTKILPSGTRVHLGRARTAPAWMRARGQCEYRTAQGLRCSSRHRLQIDHIQPLSRGGSNDTSNLRVLCWAHNQLGARTGLPSQSGGFGAGMG